MAVKKKLVPILKDGTDVDVQDVESALEVPSFTAEIITPPAFETVHIPEVMDTEIKGVYLKKRRQFAEIAASQRRKKNKPIIKDPYVGTGLSKRVNPSPEKALYTSRGRRTLKTIKFEASDDFILPDC